MDAVTHYFFGAALCVVLFLGTIVALGLGIFLWFRWDTRDDRTSNGPRPPWAPSLVLLATAIVFGVSLTTIVKFWGWPT